MKSIIRRPFRKRGFSLVELLVVIAVIGVIAAIAIPSMSSIFGESKTARNQRNAQTLVSLFLAAKSAGVEETVDDPQNPATDIAAKLSGGVYVSDASSPFNGKRFSLGETPVAEAMSYVRVELTGAGSQWSDYNLEYVSDGSGNGGAPLRGGKPPPVDLGDED